MDLNLVQRLQKHRDLLEKLTPFLVDHFVQPVGGTRAEAGHSMQEFIESRHSRETFEALRQDLPAVDLITAIGMHPTLKAVFVPREELEIFVEHLYADYEEVVVVEPEEVTK